MDTPPPYSPGSTLKIRTSETYITVAIERVFTPFTSSHVLVVRLLASPESIKKARPPPHNSLPLDTPLILKIYDTRYLQRRDARYSYDRTHFYPAQTWSLDNERKATRYREATPEWWTDPYADDDALDDEGMYIELDLYRCALRSWRDEVAAYQVLQDQCTDGTTPLGKSVPRFYHSGFLVLEEPRGFTPRVLLLEYIPDMVTLDKFQGKITQRHVHNLIAVASKLNDLGVIHYSLENRNILISADRVAIVDFGSSTVRTEEGADRFSDGVCQYGNCNVRNLGEVLDIARGFRALMRVAIRMRNKAEMAGLDLETRKKLATYIPGPPIRVARRGTCQRWECFEDVNFCELEERSLNTL